MKRREFITLLGGAGAWPLAARAQQPGERMRRIGMLPPDHAANAERTDTIACSRGGIGRAPRSEVSKARDRSGPRSAGSTR
jgi:putative ABC transport system substrate-binding protein